MVLRSYLSLCIQGRLLEEFKGANGSAGIELGSATYKANALSTIPSLWPFVVFFGEYINNSS